MQLRATHAASLSTANVRDFDFFCRLRIWIGISDVLDLHRSAVQADTNRGRCIVQASVIRAGRDDVLHGVTGQSAGYQGSHQHSRDGGIAVRKMKNVGLVQFCVFFMTLRETHSLEARKSLPGAITRRNRINSDTIYIVGRGLKHFHYVGVNLDVLQQEILVAGLGQLEPSSARE